MTGNRNGRAVRRQAVSDLIGERPPLQEQIDHLVARNVDLSTQIGELARALSPENLMLATATGYAEKNAELYKLHEEVRRLLEFGIARGVWTRDELNEALTP